MEIDNKLKADILNKLENDSVYKFNTGSGKHLRYGHCPDCSDKSLFISRNDPRRIACSHVGCTFRETVFQRYPELFENISERFPATHESPNASAEAYMSNTRGFPLVHIPGWFQQGSRPLPNGRKAATVRFMLWDGFYWERLIDAKDIRDIPKNRKAHFSTNLSYTGKGWQPPGQKIKRGDTVLIVEGIFHAIALHLVGQKVIAAFTCHNCPMEIIEENLGNKVTWGLAYDNDYNNAGNSAALKYREEVRGKGEKVEIYQCYKGKDWDDIYREDKLDDKFIAGCLHRGRLFGSESLEEKAYWLYLKYSYKNKVLDYNNSFYSVTVADDFSETFNKRIADASQQDIEGNEDAELHGKDLNQALATLTGRKYFVKSLSDNQISNCLPQFLYAQIDKINSDIAYHFKISFPKGPERQVSFTGSALKDPSSFNNALLNQAPGATFDGAPFQLKRIREKWFGDRVLTVDTVPFVGYDKSSGIYIFPDFGFSQGRYLKPSKSGFLTANDVRVKTTLKSVGIKTSKTYNPEWIDDYFTAFHYNGLVVLAFFMGSLFAEQLRGEAGFFPFLEFTGEAGAGKTTILEFCWKLLGRDDYEGFNPSKATFAARGRAFTQTANMPLTLIEGDSRDGKDAKKGGFDFSELKDLFNGRGIRATGSFNRGNDIEEPPFRGAVVIAQNATIDGDEAILTRIVHCHATRAHQKKENKSLADWFRRVDVKEVSGFLFSALSQEGDIIKSIVDNYRELDEELAQNEKLQHQRVVQCHSLVAAMVKTLPLMFPKMPLALVDETIAIVNGRALNRQGRLNADHPTVASFWEIYDLLNVRFERSEQAALAGLPGQEKETLNHSKDAGLIAISLQEFNRACEQSRMEKIDLKELRKMLPGSQKHKFVGNKTVNSQLEEGASRWCAVFKNSNHKAEK